MQKYVNFDLIFLILLILARHVFNQVIYKFDDAITTHSSLRLVKPIVYLSLTGLAIFCLARIFVTNSIVNFVCLIHPILLYFVVFSGSANNLHSAKEELIHIFKVVVFESLEMIYLAFFLPVKFARSNQQNSSDEIFIN